MSLEENTGWGYTLTMTLSDRNTVFKAGIILASVCMFFIIIAAFVVLPVYPGQAPEAVRRSTGLIQSFLGRFLEPSPFVPLVSIAGAGLYSLITLVLIYYFFEKTQCPEILFFSFFALSFAFEAVRILIPLRAVYVISPLYLLMAFRILLFTRYFGIFSLFTASVYAAGLDVQKQRNIILIIMVATMVIAMGVPIDTLSWDSSLSMISGYTSMFRMVEAGILLITMVSFFISAYSRGAGEYVLIGVGSFFVFLGRNILLGADTWASPLPALLLLAAGTWFICTQLHKVYLWL
jgi:hypothetical protein